MLLPLANNDASLRCCEDLSVYNVTISPQTSHVNGRCPSHARRATEAKIEALRYEVPDQPSR